MTDMTQIKAAARKAAFARRDAAHAKNTGTGAGMLSSVLAGYRGVPTAGYMPIRSEIDPMPAMIEAAAHGPVGVPVIIGAGQPLRFARWEPDMEMVSGEFGVQIPAHAEYFEPEIVIAPLVAFDAQGGRLGYGGGFYDRTLEGLRAKRATLAIGFAYAAQIADTLPLEPTDQPLDAIVTEQKIYDFRSSDA
ncbi:5-formyltetrahydrofolate cyclo-ligase [Roseobacter denitrificans]|uniref:5-formyltetrahydrofolate cyclo-ligase n=1 Tax=Roseobacter denitrificans (strain ATCC 33942 / OCh 114) TaxID=375451 RepID=Q168H9_ROSDO|nr:5-formyltetrahydrofolate cyclo-ligase [Roseobacter denitrificans]ABG31614.1 5-formyltetrahydrofolate cyclo-ligase, putative [Roseobacter denitrificans OCh 114]AVL54600.1 5-formyltetrahydrofolate cyclo-ligase [Roseobacter denitrificans]SFF89259.1 5-formyltetrahydrofolate cyclo-ligase [Roseobacter denitrificans OCh 114]